LSLVGASICTILGLILPCYFHLQAFERSELKWWELMLDWFLIGFGVAFGILGTYQSFVNLLA
jgi:proton-coupled amino acid transporter